MAGSLLDTTTDLGIRLLGPGSTMRGPVMGIATLIVFTYLQKVTGRHVRAYVEQRALKPENAASFMRVYNVVCKVFIGISTLVALSGSFRLLGLSVALLGTMLGWALQVPIRGLAAWVMIILKRPFRIGDRITVAGVTGDVTDIQLNHVVLNQVGGTVQGEERSGRSILVPNAMLFDQSILNYDYFGDQTEELAEPVSGLVLDEILVRITFGSDLALAVDLCVKAADQAVRELVGEPDEEPFTRCEFMTYGVLIRLRYKALPAMRQEVSSRVTELVWETFHRHRGEVALSSPGHVTNVVRPKNQRTHPTLLLGNGQ